ncbi:hypothetical protein [Scytonema hofmannii]|uniref:hypothetical protein n=1 Tax=Scytonema hofmannii TaxID=34078 RepID=UPI00034BCD2A|nr:hypothetical protein [Scytonema hofmannii]
MKAGFYVVVGNSDYCTIENRKIPIWEMLEYQPTSWLCSLSTRPEVMPPLDKVYSDLLIRFANLFNRKDSGQSFLP